MARGTVLVVDDDGDIIGLVQEALESAGYTVLLAVNGTAALQMAHDQQPDVILLDLVLPLMGGLEVSTHLRADAATAHMPIIAMSAHPGLLATSVPAADDRLPKPFAIDELFAAVGRWMPAHRAES